MIRLGLLFGFLSGCAMFGAGSGSDSQDEPQLRAVCQQMCQQKHSDTYGIQYRRVNRDVVRCQCFRHRGDEIIYINVDAYEINEGTTVDTELGP